jgi:DNA-binding NarL/FixJ family response regulator
MCRRRFKESEVMEIAAMYADGVSMIEITSAFRCFPEAVQAIASRRSYTHVVISDEITRRCAFRANPGKPGELNINAKLTPDQAREIDRLRRSGMTLSEIAKRFDVSISTVHRISRGEQYACATSEQADGGQAQTQLTA